MPAGNPDMYAQMGIPPEVVQMVEQILGRPAQSMEEFMQVLEMIMQQEGGEQGGAMPQTSPQNASLMAGIQGMM